MYFETKNFELPTTHFGKIRFAALFLTLNNFFVFQPINMIFILFLPMCRDFLVMESTLAKKITTKIF